MEVQLVILPYESDRVSERRRLVDDGLAALRLADGVQPGLRWTHLPHLLLLWLEGRWSELRTESLARNDVRLLGRLAHRRGDYAEA